MKIQFTITDDEIRQAIEEYVNRVYGVRVMADKIQIQVRSKQNYREKTWETGELQVSYDNSIVNVDGDA